MISDVRLKTSRHLVLMRMVVAVEGQVKVLRAVSREEEAEDILEMELSVLTPFGQ